MKTINLILIIFFLVQCSFSQDTKESFTPRTSGYIGTIIPLLSIDKDATSTNFNTETSLAFPLGFNLNKSPKFSYSIELDPVITISSNSSSITNLAILPGVLLHQKKVTYGIRAAFETGGRYGMSFSVLKSIRSKDNYSLVLGLPLDFRTGNKAAFGVGTGIILVVVI